MSATLTKEILHRYMFPCYCVTGPLFLYHKIAKTLPSPTDTIDVQLLVNGPVRPQQSGEDGASYQAIGCELDESQKGFKNWFQGRTLEMSQTTALRALIQRGGVDSKSTLYNVDEFDDLGGSCFHHHGLPVVLAILHTIRQE